MINIKKYTKSPLIALLSIIIPLGGLGGLISCTDTWDEHYQTGVMGEGTLWESIKNNQQLSNFARVIEATGYAKSLSSSQVFTVFAPTNDSFTDADANEIISQYQEGLAKGLKDEKNTAIKEFVRFILNVSLHTRQEYNTKVSVYKCIRYYGSQPIRY